MVENLDQAIAHIGEFGTGHSDAILTQNYAHAEKFVAQVDSAAVYVNASTRFTDGFEFGLGAESRDFHTKTSTRAGQWAWKP